MLSRQARNSPVLRNEPFREFIRLAVDRGETNKQDHSTEDCDRCDNLIWPRAERSLEKGC